MFSGIVSTVGRVKARSKNALAIAARLGRLSPGESVCVSGACLTLTRRPSGGILLFDVSDETWRRTSLGRLRPGALVNLERSLRLGDIVGGHLVTGHVDAPAEILAARRLKNGFLLFRVSLPAPLKGLIAVKGSIAVDGTSLTVTALGREFFETVLVPHTLKNTNLAEKAPGDLVNLEADIIARYVRACVKGNH